MKKTILLSICSLLSAISLLQGCTKSEKEQASKKIEMLSEDELYNLNFSGEWRAKCAAEKEQGIKNPNCLFQGNFSKRDFHEKYVARVQAVKDGSFYKD